MRRYHQIIIAVILAILLIAVMLLLIFSYEQPVEAPVYPNKMPLPTPMIIQSEESSEPEPEETEAPPAITPPADSAASGSDIILRPVEPSSDSDLTPVGTEGEDGQQAESESPTATGN